jgi:hypothetical protein
MFEARFPVVNRQLLWLGYWSLLGGGFGGIFGLIIANTLVDLANRSNNELALRMCAMGGLFVGVATNWLMSPRTSTNPFGEEYNDQVDIR